jgi:hypothetical protein
MLLLLLLLLLLLHVMLSLMSLPRFYDQRQKGRALPLARLRRSARRHALCFDPKKPLACRLSARPTFLQSFLTPVFKAPESATAACFAWRSQKE